MRFVFECGFLTLFAGVFGYLLGGPFRQMLRNREGKKVVRVDYQFAKINGQWCCWSEDHLNWYTNSSN